MVEFERSSFGEGGIWVKAGLHCHSHNSDGGLSPEDVLSRYAELGFSCVGITDHRTVTPVAHHSTESFLAIDSIEVGGRPDVIGIGARRAPDPSASLSEKARDLAGQGAFTVGAHPTYSAALVEDYLECERLMALEIFNAYCEEAYANGVATEIWDMLLGRGIRLWGVASDDAHLNPQKRVYSDAGRAWVEVWAPNLSAGSVLRSLKEGSFYSTQGPRFKTIRVDGGEIEISCSPVRQVRWRTRGSCGHVERAKTKDGITRSTLPEWFRPSGYVRVELVGNAGLRAWSNPFFVRDQAP